MSATLQLLIIAPPGKRASVVRDEQALLGFMRRSFPTFGFAVARDVPGLASDAGGFSIIPILGAIGDSGGALRAPPSSLDLLEVKDALDDYAFAPSAPH